MQIGWRKEVSEIRDRKERNPNIADVVSFVKKAASEVNDPVYGTITGASREPEREVRSQQINTRHRSTALVTISSHSNRRTADDGLSSVLRFECDEIVTKAVLRCQRFK